MINYKKNAIFIIIVTSKDIILQTLNVLLVHACISKSENLK